MNDGSHQLNKLEAQMRFLFIILSVLLLLTILSGCGRPGNMGEQGIQGAPGHDGNDAAPVTIVKLCPGTTTYPGIFVEIAFCVGGKLYGTYSANGGFSTELPPGNYNSNAIGSSCNFIILPNCIVQ